MQRVDDDLEQLKDEKAYEVYIVRNTVNGKLYVGQTCVGYMKRWYWHCNMARNNGQTVMSLAIQKYGKESFAISVHSSGLTKEEADITEQRLIRELKTMDREFGYNSTIGGEGGSQSLEVRKKMSEKKKGRTPSWMSGPNREKVLKRISEARTLVLPLEQMITMYKSGTSTYDIAAQLGCSTSTVVVRLKKNGVTIRSPELRGRLSATKFDPCQNLPDNKGSKRTDATKAKMRASNAQTRRDVLDETLVQMYEQGYSTVQIGLKVGMSHTAIRRRLRLNNVKMRSYGSLWKT